MDKKKAMRWVKALRSGKFKQAQGTLVSFKEDEDGELMKDRNGDLIKSGHCCLGVLCEVSKVPLDAFQSFSSLEGGLNKACGIDSHEGEVVNDDGIAKLMEIRVGNTVKEYGSLADANDSGVSFRCIASWIEKNYKLL